MKHALVYLLAVVFIAAGVCTALIHMPLLSFVCFMTGVLATYQDTVLVVQEHKVRKTKEKEIQ